MKRWLMTMMVFALALMVPSCSGKSDQGSKITPTYGINQPNPGTTVTAITPNTEATEPLKPTAEFADPSQVQTAIAIIASPEVVGPGEHISFSSRTKFDGDLQISGKDQKNISIRFSSGKAEIDLPANISPGVYTISNQVGENFVAVGSFRVAGSPGIWITADRSFVRDGDSVKIHVTSKGIPLETPAYIEVQDSIFSINDLGPDAATGGLVPFTFDRPPHLSDLVSKTWTLPPGMGGEVKVSASKDSTDQSDYNSNAVSVPVCNTMGRITGNIGTSGSIRAVWMEGEMRVSSVSTQSGPFQLEAGPGLVLLEVQPTGNGMKNEPKNRVVRLACGETADVGDVGLDLATSLKQAYPFLGQTLEDLGHYEATGTGSLSFDHKGSVECDLTNDTLTVKFDPGADITMSYRLEAPGVSGNGNYKAVFNLMDFSTGDASGAGSIKIVTDEVEKMMGVKGSFQASYTGKAGNGEISGNFSCFYIPSFSSHLNEHHPLVKFIPSQKVLAVLAPMSPSAPNPREPCKTGVVAYPNSDANPVLGELLATALFKTDPRLNVLTTADVQALLGLQAERLLLGADEADVQSAIDAIAGSMGADYSFWLRLDKLDSQYRLSITGMRVDNARVIVRESRSGKSVEEVGLGDIYQSVAEKMKQAGICGEIDPTQKSLSHGEKLEIHFQVTDLSGEAVDGAQVNASTPKCGSLDPVHGKTDGGKYITTYTANNDLKPCEDQLEFTAQLDTPAGTVETKSEEGRVKISVSDQWRLDMQMNLNTGQAGDTIQIQWNGFYHVNANGKIVGSGDGIIKGDLPDYPCLVLDFDHGDIRTEPNPTTLEGKFHFYIYGDQLDQGDQAKFNLDPLGVSAPMQYTFGNQNCAEGATYDPITGPIIGMAAKQPTFIMGISSISLPAQDGAQQEYSSSSSFPGKLTATIHKSSGN